MINTTMINTTGAEGGMGGCGGQRPPTQIACLSPALNKSQITLHHHPPFDRDCLVLVGLVDQDNRAWRAW